MRKVYYIKLNWNWKTGTSVKAFEPKICENKVYFILSHVGNVVQSADVSEVRVHVDVVGTLDGIL